MQYCLLLFWFLRMMLMLLFFASVMDCLQRIIVIPRFPMFGSKIIAS